MSFKYKFPFLIILLLGFFINLQAQTRLKISVNVGGKTERVSFFIQRGNIFVSSKELGEVLTGNFYYNEEAGKLEIKYTNYNLKITANNRFVVLTSRSTNQQQIFQAPVSGIKRENDIFIPLESYVKYLSLAGESEVIFDNGRKHLMVTDKKLLVQDVFEKPAPINLDPSNYSNSVAENKNSAFDVYGLSIEEKSNGTLIRVKSNKKIIRYSSSINEGQLYLFLSGVSVDPVVEKESKPVGFVRSVQRKQIAGNIQIQFKLRGDYKDSEAFQDPDGNDILITIRNSSTDLGERDLITEINRWRLSSVVIDAGHGGKDPGAIGITGLYEKKVNLGIALKLGKLIEENLDSVEVIYTRKDDSFVELFKRGKIANENNGKLFISIHCNSLGKKRPDISGFEVYLLRPGRTEEAIAIAEFENSVIHYEEDPAKYKELTDENFILVSMAHSSYMRYSEKFSDVLNEKWKTNVGIKSRGIKQAGFYVLVGASMPGVLIESGYLSNRSDEKYLKSEKGQSEIANAIFNAIKEYKIYYDSSFETEG
jgi:N-acetylmuramoyl-L-alanine amidase